MPQLTSGEAVAKPAVVGDPIVALASGTKTGYDEGDGGEAEVALVVADRYAGSGLPTVLREHLATLHWEHMVIAAVGPGMTTFVAQVMADNAAAFDVYGTPGSRSPRPHQEIVEVRLPCAR